MKKTYVHILMLTFSIWGSLLHLGFFVLIQKYLSPMGYAQTIAELLLIPFLLLPFLLSGYPISKWNKPMLVKLLVAILYYLVAALLSFFILAIGSAAIFDTPYH